MRICRVSAHLRIFTDLFGEPRCWEAGATLRVEVWILRVPPKRSPPPPNARMFSRDSQSCSSRPTAHSRETPVLLITWQHSFRGNYAFFRQTRHQLSRLRGICHTVRIPSGANGTQQTQRCQNRTKSLCPGEAADRVGRSVLQNSAKTTPVSGAVPQCRLGRLSLL
jgi:hypothetical protein